MATDIQRMIENLCHFYEFSGKTVVIAGAGGGQFIEFGRLARKIYAIDQDAEALGQLEKCIAKKGMAGLVETIHKDFYDVTFKGDVVVFDFCLHEMSDAKAAIAHARTLAPDVIIFDHFPGSEWAFYVVEEEKVRISMEAVQQAGIRRQAVFQAEHHFPSHAELLAKVAPQGPVSIERIARFKNAVNIIIPLSYGITLL